MRGTTSFSDADDFRRRCRILYVSSVDVSRGDGPGVNERDFVLALHRAIGDRSCFVIPEPADDVPELPRDRCVFTRPHQAHHPLRYLHHMASQAWQGVKLLNREPFDLMVIRPDVLPLGSVWITHRTGIPYVIKTLGRGEVEALGERGGVLGSVLARPSRALMSHLVRGALVTDACSSAMVDYLTARLGVPPGSIEWIDNAVDVSRFAPKSPESARESLGLESLGPIIGYIGSLPSERGARQIIEVAPSLLDEFPQLGVLVVGEDAALPDLRHLASTLGISERTCFAGYVPFEEVPHYVNALDVGVSISDRSNRFAAAELKVRQYLACGKPVVASPGSNDFLHREGLGSIVASTDREGITAELRRWLSLSDAQRREFENRARAFVVNRLSSEAAMNRRFQLWANALRNLHAAAKVRVVSEEQA